DKMVKQRRESLEQYEKAGRDDLAAQERFELEVLQQYMPEPLDEAQLEALISDAIKSSGAQSMRDMGPVMAALKNQVQGRADMKAVSNAVRARLTGQA
ncbi:MAG: GatB/YqeY domain-containing protein, partial [Gammaproteobacteria bacterium]|nr:GatB/YqeY domain-containing protein [Gammaproteobacteria bacterium]